MYLRINTNSTCNIDCSHCYYKAKVGFDGKTLLLSEVKDIIDQANEIYKKDLHVVIMGGGEPFLYNELFDVLAYLFALKIPTSITTNGLLLNTKILEQIKKYHILLNISLEGNISYNDSIRGAGNFRKVLKNILLCSHLGVRFSINFTLTKNNIVGIPYLIKLFSDTTEYITFSRYIPYIPTSSIEPLSREDYLVVEKILNKFKNKKIRYRQETFLKEKKFIASDEKYNFSIEKLKSLYILPNKTVYPAWNLIDYKLGDLRENSLREILSNGRAEKLYDPEMLEGAYCGNCKHKYNCAGDRGVAYFYTGNFWGDDIQCPYYVSR